MKLIKLVCEAVLIVEKQGNPNATGKIEATVTTWGAREGADGRRFNYQAAGFQDWVNEFAQAGKPLPMFVNHQADAIPVGEWNNFEMTDSGMTATGRIYLNTTAGKDIYTVMQESPSMFGGVSVGAFAEMHLMVDADGNPIDADDQDEGYFQITKGGLREVSVVMYPNNLEANVSSLEFFRADGSADLKILESALRDVGLSKSDAVAAASTFKRVLELRDVAIKPIETAPPQSDSDAEATTTEILAALEQRELLISLNKRLKG